MIINLIKLTTGEEVIAETQVVSNGLLLKNPVKLGMTPQGLAMVPLSPFAQSKEVTIKNEHVLFIDEPELEILNGYKTAFNKGVLLPGSGLIT